MISTSTRNAAPAPIDIKSPSVAHPARPVRSDSDTPLPPKRADTMDSEDSYMVESPASMPKSPGPSPWRRDSPTVNVHTHCGRHGDQFLFSGPSLRELARTMLRRTP
ncbi:hypothetical protein CC79DRAFT_22316 [Sarocladium strictum]